MYHDPWGASLEIADELYCCPLCPTANDGSFVWNPTIDQEICSNCEREIYLAFIWPESRRGVVDLYPAVIRKLMDTSGRSYRECQQIYIEHDMTSLAEDILEDDDDSAIKVFITPDGSQMTRTEMLEKLRSIRSRGLVK